MTIYVRPTSAPFAAGSHDDARMPDEIRFVKFSSITWDLKSEGFFYQVGTQSCTRVVSDESLRHSGIRRKNHTARRRRIRRALKQSRI